MEWAPREVASNFATCLNLLNKLVITNMTKKDCFPLIYPIDLYHITYQVLPTGAPPLYSAHVLYRSTSHNLTRAPHLRLVPVFWPCSIYRSSSLYLTRTPHWGPRILLGILPMFYRNPHFRQASFGIPTTICNKYNSITSTLNVLCSFRDGLLHYRSFRSSQLDTHQWTKRRGFPMSWSQCQ